jgi:biopolymer transport protein ExbD
MLVTTNFAPQPGIQVKLLPPVGWEPQKVWDELDLWEKTRLIIRVINPEETEKYGIMILNDEIVDFQDLPGKFQNVPNESKRMLIIQSERDVLHEQIVMIADVAKRTGVREIAYLPLTYAPRNRPKG